jgi:hypothetical protein
MRALTSLLIIPLAIALPSRSEAASLRCGNQLASDGASTSEVLMRCGEPMAKESRQVTLRERTSTRNEREANSSERAEVKTIEEWTYNFGPHRLIQVVVFENGRLIDVRSAGYGR